MNETGARKPRIETEEMPDAILAGIIRAERGNMEERESPDWKRFHKPSLGPHSEKNPCQCVNCGKILTEENMGEECPA